MKYFHIKAAIIILMIIGVTMVTYSLIGLRKIYYSHSTIAPVPAPDSLVDFNPVLDHSEIR